MLDDIINQRTWYDSYYSVHKRACPICERNDPLPWCFIIVHFVYSFLSLFFIASNFCTNLMWNILKLYNLKIIQKIFKFYNLGIWSIFDCLDHLELFLLLFFFNTYIRFASGFIAPTRKFDNLGMVCAWIRLNSVTTPFHYLSSRWYTIGRLLLFLLRCVRWSVRRPSLSDRQGSACRYADPE